MRQKLSWSAQAAIDLKHNQELGKKTVGEGKTFLAEGVICIMNNQR